MAGIWAGRTPLSFGKRLSAQSKAQESQVHVANSRLARVNLVQHIQTKLRSHGGTVGRFWPECVILFLRL